MLDRRFLDARITIDGFLASPPAYPEYERNYILAADWGEQYPDAVKGSIATYHYTWVNGTRTYKWVFTKPNQNTTMEVINIATGEILRYGIISSSYSTYGWITVGHVNGLRIPFVVDAVFDKNPPTNTSENIGLVYIVTNLNDDTKVYQITREAEGDAGRKVLGILTLGQKIIVKSREYFYIVKTKTVSETNEETEEETERLVSYLDVATISDGITPEIPQNTLIFATETKNVFLTDKNRSLFPLKAHLTNAGDSSGILTVKRHVFTATEINTRRIDFSDVVLAENLDKTMCFMNGNVHVHAADFIAALSSNQLYVYWDSPSHNWYDNPPREGEVGIFMYFKE